MTKPDWRALLQALIDDVDAWEDCYDHDCICKSCYKVVRTWKHGQPIKHLHRDDCAYIAAITALEAEKAKE